MRRLLTAPSINKEKFVIIVMGAGMFGIRWRSRSATVDDADAGSYLPVWPYLKAALVVWFAEIIIGTLPLAAHLLITYTIELPVEAAQLHKSGFLPEECIVIVVISGLALVTVFEFEPRASALKEEPTTCFMLLAALLSLMFTSMFYGIATAEMVLKSQSVVHSFLIISLVASLSVAVRKAHGERDLDAAEWDDLLSDGVVAAEADDHIAPKPINNVAEGFPSAGEVVDSSA